MGVSTVLDQPFYTGSPGSADGARFLPVSIAGHEYQIDVTQYQRSTVAKLRPSMDTGSQPGLQSLSIEGLWRRTAQNWWAGAGQTFWDQPDSNGDRYWSSKGIDPWTKRQVTLLADTEQKLASTATGMQLFQANGLLYVVDGSHLRFTADPTPTAPTFTTINVVGTIVGASTDGNNVYLAVTGLPIQRIPVGSSTAANFGTFPASMVGYANGRLLAAAGPTLVEVNGAGQPGGVAPSTTVTAPTNATTSNTASPLPGGWSLPVASTAGYTATNASVTVTSDQGVQTIVYQTVDATNFKGCSGGNGNIPAGAQVSQPAPAGLMSFTHVNPSFTWTLVCPSPGGIYVAGQAGSVCEIYQITPNTDSSLKPPVVVCQMPAGETVRAMIFYGGNLFLGTSRGFRLGVVSTSGVQIGPLTVIPGGVSCCDGAGEFVWFGWSNFDGGATGVGRANLSRFTDTAVPAYASDAMTPSGVVAQGQVGSVAAVGGIDGRRYFTVDGLGVYGETTNLVPTGTVNSGWVTYAAVDRKVAANVDLSHDALAGQISLTVLFEGATPDVAVTSFACGSSLYQGSVAPPSPLGVGNTGYERAALALTLTRSTADATVGPTLRRWTFRSLITPLRTDEIVAPLIFKTKVTNAAGEGQPVYYDLLEEFHFLKAIENAGAIVTYMEGSNLELVYLDGVQMKPSNWSTSPPFDAIEGTLMVRMLTLPSYDAPAVPPPVAPAAVSVPITLVGTAEYASTGAS